MKKYLLGCFAIALAIGFSAFSSARVTNYFKFIGSDNTELKNPAKWEVTNSAYSCAPSDETICRVVANSTFEAFKTALGVDQPDDQGEVLAMDEVDAITQRAE
jgi:hypothetical protein